MGQTDAHGRPHARVCVACGHAAGLYAGKRPSFTDLLLSIPEDLETERDPTPMRVPDL